jgi:sugar phosphate isomerase/epimerase
MLRRQALFGLTSSLAAAVWIRAEESRPRTPHLAIGNYGMKSLTLEESITQIAAIGFGAFECCANAEWDSTPSRMPKDRRQRVAGLLGDHGLRLAAVMENLPPSADDKLRQAALVRMREAIELGRDLAPQQQPLVQTVLGGGKWDEVKTMFRDRVGDWAKLAQEQSATICIKPHRFGAMSTPAQAVWLIEQLGSPTSLKIVYDFSHYVFRDLTIEGTIAQANGLVAYVAMKDAAQTGDKITFALPGGSQSVDHAAIRTALHQSGFQGDYCCEVSSQISQLAGYDPIEAAKTCYRNLAKTFTE